MQDSEIDQAKMAARILSGLREYGVFALPKSKVMEQTDTNEPTDMNSI